MTISEVQQKETAEDQRLRQIGVAVAELMNGCDLQPWEQCEVLLNVLLLMHEALGVFLAPGAQDDLERAVDETLAMMRQRRLPALSEGE